MKPPLYDHAWSTPADGRRPKSPVMTPMDRLRSTTPPRRMGTRAESHSPVVTARSTRDRSWSPPKSGQSRPRTPTSGRQGRSATPPPRSGRSSGPAWVSGSGHMATATSNQPTSARANHRSNGDLLGERHHEGSAERTATPPRPLSRGPSRPWSGRAAQLNLPVRPATPPTCLTPPTVQRDLSRVSSQFSDDDGPAG